jgi:hypothetical protein
MKILFYSFLLGVLCTQCIPASGQTNSIMRMASPQLRQFVSRHPQADQVLSNALSQSFSNRSVQIFYFYTDDKSVARACHYYPSESVVGICIKENQATLDGYISLLYETLNSQNESKFEELFRKATAGEISQPDFSHEMSRLEFMATIKTRDLLKSMKFSKSEKSDSECWIKYRDCPEKFEDFLAYCVKVSPSQDITHAYYADYNMLRADALATQTNCLSGSNSFRTQQQAVMQ